MWIKLFHPFSFSLLLFKWRCYVLSLKTGEEMRKMMTDSSVLTLRNGKHIQKRGDVKIPKTLDWRTQGYVGPVRKQV